jgi:hypothetical protein
MNSSNLHRSYTGGTFTGTFGIIGAFPSYRRVSLAAVVIGMRLRLEPRSGLL